VTWRWISQASAEAFHSEQIDRFGGARGIRDIGLLPSELDRPQNKAAYEDPDAFELAAAYLYGLARNHPFVDGNKRTAIVVAAVFLMKHGYRITSDNGMLYQFVVDVAAGAVSEDSAARWFRDFTETMA
jgi:death-on-curing protein